MNSPRLFLDRIMVGAILCALYPPSVGLAQQPPAWRTPDSLPPSPSISSVRVALKPRAEVQNNVLELQDIAELSGSENLVQRLQTLPLGPAPIRGSSVTWSQSDILRILELRGIETRTIRWAGDDRCQVFRVESLVSETQHFTPSHLNSQTVVLAERTVASVILAYLQKQSVATTGWIIKPTVPDEHAKLLSQRRTIQGINGGHEPWTGTQQFQLLVTDSQGHPQTISVRAQVELPPMVLAVTGPFAKGHVLSEQDLKLVRLTSSMKAQPDDCYTDASKLVGRELRRNLSTGQPILRTDTGPPRIIHVKDLVKIQVLAGAITAETTGRALQAGGMDEVIEVEVTESKKRLAARVIAPNTVEVIAR